MTEKNEGSNNSSAGCAMVVLALVMLYYLAPNVYQIWYLNNYGVQVTATIIGNKSTSRHGTGDTGTLKYIYSPVLNYKLEDKDYSVTLKANSRKKFTVGKSIDILVDPDNPEYASGYASKKEIPTNKLVTLFGIIPGLLAGGFILIFKKSS